MRKAVVVVVCLLASYPSAADEIPCQSAVDAEISRLGVSPERVSEYIVVLESLPDASDIGYKFWLRLKGCTKGYLVVDTDLACNIEQTFTDGPCPVSGVPSY